MRQMRQGNWQERASQQDSTQPLTGQVVGGVRRGEFEAVVEMEYDAFVCKHHTTVQLDTVGDNLHRQQLACLGSGGCLLVSRAPAATGPFPRR